MGPILITSPFSDSTRVISGMAAGREREVRQLNIRARGDWWREIEESCQSEKGQRFLGLS